VSIEQAGQSTPAPRPWNEGEPNTGEIVRAFWYDEPFIGKVCNGSVELTQGGKKIVVRDLTDRHLLYIVDRSTATHAEHCYFEGCDGWILDESDYCPEHAKLYAPAPPSSVSPSGENTTPPVSVPAAQPGRGTTNGAVLVSSDGEAVSSRVSSRARDELILAIAHPAGSERNLGPRPWECGPCERAERIADAVLAAGWRPTLPKMDADSLRSRVGALIDELAFHDDNREKALEIAQALIDGGWVDRSGAFGDPEPVAHTLRRVIQDLESEAMFRDPMPMIGAYSERSADDVTAARALSEYADRLRKHPALTGEAPPTVGPHPSREERANPEPEGTQP